MTTPLIILSLFVLYIACEEKPSKAKRVAITEPVTQQSTQTTTAPENISKEETLPPNTNETTSIPNVTSSHYRLNVTTLSQQISPKVTPKVTPKISPKGQIESLTANLISSDDSKKFKITVALILDNSTEIKPLKLRFHHDEASFAGNLEVTEKQLQEMYLPIDLDPKPTSGRLGWKILATDTSETITFQTLSDLTILKENEATDVQIDTVSSLALDLLSSQQTSFSGKQELLASMTDVVKKQADTITASLNAEVVNNKKLIESQEHELFMLKKKILQSSDDHEKITELIINHTSSILEGKKNSTEKFRSYLVQTSEFTPKLTEDFVSWFKPELQPTIINELVKDIFPASKELPKSVNYFGGEITRFVSSNSYLYLVKRYRGLEIFHINDDFSWEWMSQLDLNKESVDIILNDTYIYLASGSEGIQVINVANIEKPEFVIAIKPPTNGHSVRLLKKDNLLFVAEKLAGLSVYDISTAQKPTLIVNKPITGSLIDISMNSSTLYGLVTNTATNNSVSSSVITINYQASNISYEPIAENISAVNDSFKDFKSLTAYDDFIWVVDNSGAAKLISSLSSNVTTIGDVFKWLFNSETYNLGINAGWSARKDNYLYFSSDSTPLAVADVSVFTSNDPFNVLYILDTKGIIGDLRTSIILFGENQLSSLSISGNVLFNNLLTYGISIFSLQQPQTPSYKSLIPTLNWPVELLAYKNAVYVADAGLGLFTFETINTSYPQLKDFISTKNPLQQDMKSLISLASYNNYLFTTFTDHGIELYSLSNPLKPSHIKTYSSYKDAVDLVIHQQSAYVLTSEGLANKIYIFDISTPDDMKKIGELDLDTGLETWLSKCGFNNCHMEYHDQHLMLNMNGRIAILNVSDVNHIKIASELPYNSEISSLLASDSQTLFSIHMSSQTSTKLVSYDVKDKSKITKLHEHSFDFSISSIYLDQQTLYVVSDKNLYLMDVSNPSSLTLIKNMPISAVNVGWPQPLLVQAKFLFMANRSSGLSIFNKN